MTREAVKSSNIKSVGYDAETETLEIEFNTGDVYEYYYVPSDVYKGLMGAASKGQYFSQNIKGSHYDYEKI